MRPGFASTFIRLCGSACRAVSFDLTIMPHGFSSVGQLISAQPLIVLATPALAAASV